MRFPPSLACTSLLVLTLGLAVPAHAEEQRESNTAAQDAPSDDFHDRRVDDFGEIVVSAVGVTQLDVLAGTSVMEGTELQSNLDGQVGEVLAKLPGVSATGFSPGASRPVLRGFSGERVKVLVDGLGALDASNTSADHAVSIDPLTAERIEVLRGPAVLLFGSQAIGGAVNVIDKRIPLRRMKEPFHIDALAGFNTAADLREGGASLDLPLGQMFVFHADGAYRKTDDLSVPGYVIAPGLRTDLLADAAEHELDGEPDEAEELREAALQRGKLPNSATETWSANAGLALFAGESNLGFSFGIYDTSYGVPGRPGMGHLHEEGAASLKGLVAAEGEDGHGEGDVTIGMRQYRADMRGELALGGGFFSQLRTRVGYSDYTHTEFEGDEVGTVFKVAGIEARAELIQKQQGSWRGSIGTQYYFRDFEAIGAEAFVAPNRTDQFAVFALQEVGVGPVQLEFAGRYESTAVNSNPLGVERDFSTLSGAIGIAHETEGGLRFGVTGSRAQRAPSGEELFSDGPHIATQAYEVGDPGLSKESAWGLEGYVRGRLGLADISFAVFKNWFSDYIYLSETGLEEDALPVFAYLQGDASYFGVEGEVTLPIIDSGPFRLVADLRGDYVRARLSDGTPLPRIPPLSLLGALEGKTEHFDGRVEVQWFDSQTSTAPFETATDSFAFVNASLAWKPLRGGNNLTILFQVDNIFNAEGRRHASFTKDFVPLAGRNFKLSARVSL
ncbi:MAG: TonB-dependent receptor [Sphingomonadaceae bacterium]|nr:TonB-dependent receptor [Sphingomonadaceae bacterium]